MQKQKINNWSKGFGPSVLIGFLAFLAGLAGCGGAAADLTDGEYLAVSDSYDHDGWAAYALLRVESGEIDRLAELERHAGSFERVLLAVLDAAETAVDEPVVVEAAGDEPVELNEIERLTRVSEEKRVRLTNSRRRRYI